MKVPANAPMANVQPNGQRLGWKGGLYDPSQAQTPAFRPGQAQSQQSPYDSSTPYGQPSAAPTGQPAAPYQAYGQAQGRLPVQPINMPPTSAPAAAPPQPNPEGLLLARVSAEVAARHAQAQQTGFTDYSLHSRPPVARPNGAPAPYTNQDEYRRYMNQAMPGWHTDRQLKEMVPWEFNPANPDRGERPSGLSAFMQQMR